MAPDRRPWLLPLLAFLYLFPYPYFPVLRSPNEGSRLYQARALVDDGTFAVNGPLERYGPMGDLAVFDGRYFPNKAPGISILGAAVYAVAKALVLWRPERISNEALLYLLRACCCAIPTLIFLAAARRRLWLWTSAGIASDAAVLTYGLGSLAYTYGLLFFSHQFCAVLLGSAFLLLETAREEDRLAPAAWAGLCAGSAVLVEYTAALAALPLGLYTLWAFRRRLLTTISFGLSSLPPQLLLLGYHKLAYGDFLESGYKHNVNRQFQSWHDRGFMGVTTPTWRSLQGSFFDPAKGLLVFSPFLVLGIVGVWLLWRDPERRKPAVLLGGLVALYALFTASFIYEAWGWTVGPRHLSPLAAFLVLPAGVAMAKARRRSAWWSGLATGLCVLSVLFTGLATVTYPHYPEVFGNGFFQLTVPLLLGGYLPRNALGLWLGVGPWCWALYFGGFAFAVAWLAWSVGASGKARGLGLATVMAGALILASSGGAPNPAQAQQRQFVEQTYRAP